MGKTDQEIDLNDYEYNPKKVSKAETLKKHFSRIKKREKLNSNKWTIHQDLKFLEFMEQDPQRMNSFQRRKAQRVFLQLSVRIRTRTSDQCRSHHQKLLQYYHDAQGIIVHLQELIKFANFHSQEKQAAEEIQTKKQISEFEQQFSSQNSIQLKDYQETNIFLQDESLWNVINDEFWSI